MVSKEDIEIPKDEWHNYEEGIFVDPREVGAENLPGFESVTDWASIEDRESSAWGEDYQRELAQEYVRDKERFEEERKQERWKQATHDRPSAELGDLVFKDAFDNPDVDVTHDRQTAEHEVVSGYNAGGDGVEYVVQTIGRKPPEIKVNGWVTEHQLGIADDLVGESFIEMVTDRWTGLAVPLNVDTPYNRTFHEDYGRIFEVTIELVGIQKELSRGGSHYIPKGSRAGSGEGYITPENIDYTPEDEED